MPNPFLEKLGYAETDRLVILHADDIGMCQASVQAFEELWDFGTVSAGAVMVPCPWFPAVAEMCKRKKDVDMGVHATLNSEWTAYRWGPISTSDPATGLLDQDGYFHQWHPAVYENANPAAVAIELNAQVDRALSAGIDVTHIDSHMGTILHPNFVQPYLEAGTSRKIPNMLPFMDGAEESMIPFSSLALANYAELVKLYANQGYPLIDRIVSMPLDHDEDHFGVAKKIFMELPAGITHFLFHPSIESPELKAACPDWRARVANFKTFMRPEFKTLLGSVGIHVIGYRALRDAVRA